MTRPLVIVGDALLDRDLDGQVSRLCPDAPVPVVDDPIVRARPGGAGLAALLAAAASAGTGTAPVLLVSAIARDPAGRELRGLLAAAGVEVVDLGLNGPTPEKIRVCAGGRPLLRIDHGGVPGTPGPPNPEALRALAGAGAILVSDYGRGMTRGPALRAALADAARARPLVWDPHPRGTAPVAGTRLATPNDAEAEVFVPDPAGEGVDGQEVHDHGLHAHGLHDHGLHDHGIDGSGNHRGGAGRGGRGRGLAAVAGRGRALVRRWAVGGVVITLGERGALLVGADGTPLMVPAPAPGPGQLPGPAADTCGAGDRFATAAAAVLAAGALPSEAVAEAVETASRFVATGGVGGLRPPAQALGGRAPAHRRSHDPGRRPGGQTTGATAGTDAFELAAAVHAAGGTVVATGGCFDLLHAGHVRALEAARSLGDCLIVCLNADESVRRLKGSGRPLVAQADRASVLLGLACVDAVEIFTEDTPIPLLERLRPHLWAKGADYAVADLPEAAVVERWGGQAVVVPYLAGHSTTRLIEEASNRDHR